MEEEGSIKAIARPHREMNAKGGTMNENQIQPKGIGKR